MDINSLLEDYKRKKVLLQEDMDYLLKISDNICSILEKKEEDMHKMIETMAKYPKVEDEIVRFNVGGTIFATSRSNLTKKILKKAQDQTSSASASEPPNEKFYEPSLLEGLVSGIAEIRLDSSGAIFIDRNPRFFDIILDYLRAANSISPFELSSDFKDRKGLLKEAEFYNVQGLISYMNSTPEKNCIDSIILKQTNKDENFINWLTTTNIPSLQNKTFKLLYRASEHGFSATAFHQRCNDQGATLTILRVSGSNSIIGGYTSAAWDSGGSYKHDSQAFLFSLLGSDNRPNIANCTNPPHAILCNSSYGPIFGSNDLFISNGANVSNQNQFKPGFSYNQIPNGLNQIVSLNAAKNNFNASEIEVFQVNS